MAFMGDENLCFKRTSALLVGVMWEEPGSWSVVSNSSCAVPRSAQTLPCQFGSYCWHLYSLLQEQILSQFLMVSALSWIFELHSCPGFALVKAHDVCRAFQTAVTLVSPGRGVAGNQCMLSSLCVWEPCFLPLAKVLHGIVSKSACVASITAVQYCDIVIMLYF